MSRVTIGNNSITRGYNAITHRGVDIGWKTNEKDNEVTAHSNGVVVWLQTGQKNNPKATGNASYGNCIKLKHSNGYFTLYAHLKSVKVKKGESVKQGEVIAVMGNTGKSTARHLHFEVRKPSDTRINPTKYIYANLPNMTSSEKYQTYDNVKNKWLPKVKTGTNDYAGNLGNPISGLRITNLKYRVKDKVKGYWLPYVVGDKDFAGNLPNNINGIEIIDRDFEVHTINGKWQSATNGIIETTKAIDGVRIK